MTLSKNQSQSLATFCTKLIRRLTKIKSSIITLLSSPSLNLIFGKGEKPDGSFENVFTLIKNPTQAQLDVWERRKNELVNVNVWEYGLEGSSSRFITIHQAVPGKNSLIRLGWH